MAEQLKNVTWRVDDRPLALLGSASNGEDFVSMGS
jgi:hypothetical protein